MPISEALATILQSDRTAALAAAVIIGTCHSDVLQWVARTICGEAPAPQPKPRANGAARRGRKADGHRSPRSNGGGRKPGVSDAYLSRRREARDADDQALVNAMRSNPDGSIGDWATMIHKSRTSSVSALHRLRDAGLAGSVEGKWRLAEEPPLREPPARWVAPLSAGQRAHAHA